ncbi:F-box only protein 36a [Plectropomus leopardus]|uniref:F-box only protein 36a n=1 Tax=Plectropomus leopardus TaxID=160734 RepID=UPI001C4BC937|nr:F-box only protein 36a [Plectropomus leopardus]
MACLLGEHLFKISGQGPPPSKDFFQLLITKTEVIWSRWQISVQHVGRATAPEELKISHHDFLDHKTLQRQIGAVFGQRILEYTRSLCQGKLDYLERLPDDILLQILSYLELKDIAQLAQVSKRFRKVCNSERFWEQYVRNRCADFNSDMENIANARSWKILFYDFLHTSGSKKQQ